jgi:hypothetical protein
MDNKGQTVLSEYVMIFFVVIAAAVAMTTYVQRALEARIHDERNFMIDSVTKSGACDASCLAATGATGGKIPYSYEPYYANMYSFVQQNQQDTTTATTGKAAVLGATYNKILNDNTQTGSTSCQLPPQCAGLSGALPCECQCPSTC